MNRIDREKKVVAQMVRLYCRRCEGNRTLCADCSRVLDYAMERLSRCPFGCNKPTCKRCSVHCYNPAMRERIRAIMRWSGPRMILYHPIAAICHLFREMPIK